MLATVVRIPFVFLPPVLSDDVFRHRWDGRVLAAGLDPYRHAPAELAGSPLHDREQTKINHPEVPTVYGPLAQGFLAALALSPLRASVRSIKGLAAAFDLLSVASLASLGVSLGAGPLAALLFALHPLAVIETAGEGHLDGVAVSLLLLGCALLARGRGRTGAALLACATLVKLTPAAAAPGFLRTAGWKGSLLAATVFALAHAPFFASGGGAEFKGLATYARSWEGNGVIYPDLVLFLKRVDAAGAMKSAYAWMKRSLAHPAFMDRMWPFLAPEYVARAFLGGALLVTVALILRTTRDPFRAAGASIGALLFFSPTLHPWYLLNLLPFALLFRWWGAVWVAGAAPLVYLATLPRGAPVFPHPDIIRAIEFLPAAALFLSVDLRKRAR